MKLRYLIPSLLTFGNFFCGLYSIYFALQDRPLQAALLILAAMVFDFADGRMARLLKAESEFGFQLDSLSDFLSFGIAPMLLVYTLFLQENRQLAWIFVLLYTGCGVLRLARHNVLEKAEARNYFSGLPIPLAAGFVVGFVLIYIHSRKAVILTIIPALIVCVALLMASNIRYPNLRYLNLKKGGLFLLLLFFSFIGAIFFHCLAFIFLLYVSGYVLVGVFLEARRKMDWPKWKSSVFF